MRFADPSRGRPFAKDPAVVWFNGRYWLYYSLCPYRDDRLPNGFSIGVAASENLQEWTRIGEILPTTAYERNGLAAPGAIVLEGRVHLFYQTYGNGPKDAICHAVSEDGLTFTRHPHNPIFHPTGDWNVGRAIDADCIVYDGYLYLFFATRDPAMKIQMLGVARAPLESGFGPETWEQLGEGPLLRPELPWEQECIEAPALCRHGDQFFLFYGGAYNNSPQQIGCAVSQDLVHWSRLSDRPFLPNGAPGSWNACESGHPFVFTDPNGATYLFYQGNNDMGQSWFISYRTIRWIDGAPALIPGERHTGPLSPLRH